MHRKFIGFEMNLNFELLVVDEEYLLLQYLVAFGAKRLVILGKELPVQFFLASMTSETLLVVNLSKCCAAIISQIPFAVVTTF